MAWHPTQLNKEQKKYAIQSELKVEKKLTDAIKTGQKSGIYSNILSAETVAAHIKPLLHDWYLKRWKYSKRDTSVDDYVAHVLSFVRAFCFV